MAEIVKKKSYQRAFKGLRQAILTGTLATGERVSEVALAEELSVSRTPLREAMSELVEQGLLERLPSGGCVVRSFTRSDIVDSIELRGLLEGMAFRIAAERGVDPIELRKCKATIAQIDSALGPTKETTDFERYFELNEVLHQQMANLCDSRVILRELQRVTRMPLAGPSAFLYGQNLLPGTLNSLFVAQGQHRAILDAIANREGTRAEFLAREHARLALRNFDYFLYENTGSADQIPGLSLVQDPLAQATGTA